MSLINNMLRDLETRTKRIPISRNIYADLQVTWERQFKKNRFYFFLIAGLIALSAFITLNLLSHLSYFTDKKSITPKVIANPVSTNAVENSLPIAEQTAPSLLSSIALQIQGAKTSLRFLLSKNTLYRLQANPSANEISIILEHTHLLAALPQFKYEGSGIQQIGAFSDENDNLKIVLHLNPNAQIKKLDLDGAAKIPEMQIEIDNAVNSVRSIANTLPVTIKKQLVDNDQDQLYQKAQSLLSVGQKYAAEQLLTKLVAESPDYLPARKSLAVLFLQQNNLNEAEKIINIGLLQKNNDADLIQLKARLLVQKGELQEAINLLVQSPPPLELNPDYHAFIAALYQRSGQFNLAVNLYNQLLGLQPQNALWWMGLGVALESSGNHSQAVEAYSAADNIGTLSPELKAFVETRLHSA